MREVPFNSSISKTDFIRNSSLPLSPPLSTSQTPNASPSSLAHDSNAQTHRMQEKHSSSPVQKTRPPPSPTSSVTTPTSGTGPDAGLKAPVPNAWKTVGSPSGLQHASELFSNDDPEKENVNEYGAKNLRASELREDNEYTDGYEEFELELSSEDGYYDGPKLIGSRRSSEGIAVRGPSNVHNQYNRDTSFATGDESAPDFYLGSPGQLGGRRGSDGGANTSVGMGASSNTSAKWGSIGYNWTAGASIWNGSSNGNGRSKSVVGGTSSSPLEESPSSRSVSFSGVRIVGNNPGTRSPIGTGSVVDRPDRSERSSLSLNVGYLGDEFEEEQPQFRQARSRSFALGQQETDFFGLSNDAHAQSNSSQANYLARRGSSSAVAHSFDDSELYGSEHHATSSSISRGLDNSFHQSLPSMTEELYDSADDHPDSSLSPSETSYVAFTLPKMRARNKSSTATSFAGMGRENTASSHNSSSASSPMARVRTPTGYGLSPQQQQMLQKSVTAPSSVSSSPYRHRASVGGLAKLSMPPSVEEPTPATAYANIWRDDSKSADGSQQSSASHNTTGINQRRRSITTPNEYWPVTLNTTQQNAGKLSVNINAGGNNYTQGRQSPSPELLERVRIHRRLSLNPALASLGNAQGGMGVGGMNLGMGSGISNNNMGMGSTGNYGEYRYLESGQGLGMLNRSVEPEYAHLNQRRHSVAGPTLSFGNSSQSRYLTDALDALQLEDNSVYGNQQHHGMVEESSLDDYFDNDERRAARVAAATASGNYGGIPSANSVSRGAGTGLGHSRDVDAHLGKGVPLHAVPHHGPLYIVEFKAGRSDLFYLVPESPSQQVKKGDLVIVEADRGKDLGKVVNDNITPVQVQMLQQQQAEAAAVAEMGISILPDGSFPRMVSGIPGSNVPVKELHPKRIYRLAQPSEVTMLVTKSQDEAKAMLLCQTKVRQKNLPMEVVDAEYQWDRRKLTFYFIAERRIDFRELVRELFKIYKTRIWMCAVNPNVNSGMNVLRK